MTHSSLAVSHHLPAGTRPTKGVYISSERNGPCQVEGLLPVQIAAETYSVDICICILYVVEFIYSMHTLYVPYTYWAYVLNSWIG